MNIFTARFKKYLTSQKLVGKKLSANSIKNYLSDVRHFFRWLEENKKRKTSITIADFTPVSFQAYKNSLSRQHIPDTTLCRRLASLRKFGQFLVQANFLGTDPAAKLTNPKAKHLDPELLQQFKTYLKSQKLAKTTIKNYLADIKQFTQWSHNKS